MIHSKILVSFLWFFLVFSKYSYSSEHKATHKKKFTTTSLIKKIAVASLLILNSTQGSLAQDYGSNYTVELDRGKVLNSEWGVSSSVNKFLDEKIKKFRRSRLRGRPEGRSLNIFDEDDRELVNSNKYPGMAVGKLTYKESDGQDYYCTATLIARDYILTAAHCVFETVEDQYGQNLYRFISQNWKDNLEFHPAYSGSFSADVSSWESVTFSKQYSTLASGADEQDWALIKISKAFGDAYGWFSLVDMEYSDYNQFSHLVDLMGYSYDKYMNSAGGAYDCELFGSASIGGNRQVMHNCDSTAGSSGSGIYFLNESDASGGTIPQIAAVHRARMVAHEDETIVVTYSKATSNLAAETSRLYRAFAYLLNQNSSELPSYSNVFVSPIGLKPSLPVMTEDIVFESEFGIIYNEDISDPLLDEIYKGLILGCGALSSFMIGSYVGCCFVSKKFKCKCKANNKKTTRKRISKKVKREIKNKSLSNPLIELSGQTEVTM